jgi:hypothetical protein
LETFFGSTFSLSTAGGELHLFSAAGGALTGYDTGTSYGGILEGMSLGLLESGDGFHYGMTRTPTPGAPNTAWLSSPLILTEFYFPESAPELAFVELRNVGTGALLLGPEWGLRGSFSYTFPASGLVVESGQIVLLARDPGELQASGAIREDVALLGPLLEGTGNPVGEIELKVVTASEPLAQAAHVAVLESVTFAERASWIPPEAPLGHSLQRRNPWAEAALPENWRLSQEAGGSPGEIDLGTYGLWRELSFSGQDPDALDPLADPDGDRSLNLEEYAFGTDPLDSDSFHRPSIARTGPPGQASIELRYQRPADIADVIYEAEISSDMNTWRTVTQPFLESAVRTPLDGGFEEVLFTAIMPAEARFIRIKLRMLP